MWCFYTSDLGERWGINEHKNMTISQKWKKNMFVSSASITICLLPPKIFEMICVHTKNTGNGENGPYNHPP